MECNYHVVESENLNTSNVKCEWKPFLRQVHIASAVWTMFYLAGVNVGAPTVFIPQLRKENHTIDDELASWLYSISNITAIPWVLILPTLTQYAGRRPLYILTCVCVSAVSIIMYYSSTPYDILAAGVIQGFANASNITVMSLILIEYSTMKYRNIFMSVTTASCFWGIWTSNAIGTYFYWKYIAVLGIFCSSYTFTIALYPESPMWLASKGKIKKSEAAFKWLHGDMEGSKQFEAMKSQIRQASRNNSNEQGFYAIIRKKEFYQPVLLCVLIGAQYNFSGKYVCSAYAIEVISKMTDSTEAAHTGMLILDGVTILGMYFGSYLSKKINRKTHYYSSAFMGVIFLLMMSLYLYLVRFSILAENNTVTIILLVAYSLSLSSGCMILGYAMYSELILIKYQRVSYMIFSVSLFVITSIMLKFAPMAFKYLGIHGMFLFNAITFGTITVILYFCLPETEGKTFIEIEQLFCSDKEDCFNLKQNERVLMTTNLKA